MIFTDFNRRKLTGLILGPLLFVLVFFFLHPKGLSREGVAILASTFWIAAWWITEAIPIPAHFSSAYCFISHYRGIIHSGNDQFLWP